MNSLSTIIAESIAGMGITLALLALLALIFHMIGILSRRHVEVSPPEVIKKEANISSLLPFIATAVYLYRVGEEMKFTKMKGETTVKTTIAKRTETLAKSIVVNSSREEWKKCGRRDCLR
ncbi:MAG: hypothetical protein N3D12_06035 [Candidatus Methanomethyliaceae archaeon]|nr:hypothetical protein [Candidatus Methanomethyliaceae archaeon]